MARKIITAIDVGSSKITTVITSVEDNKAPMVIALIQVKVSKKVLL